MAYLCGKQIFFRATKRVTKTDSPKWKPEILCAKYTLEAKHHFNVTEILSCDVFKFVFKSTSSRDNAILTFHVSTAVAFLHFTSKLSINKQKQKHNVNAPEDLTQVFVSGALLVQETRSVRCDLLKRWAVLTPLNSHDYRFVGGASTVTPMGSTLWAKIGWPVKTRDKEMNHRKWKQNFNRPTFLS